MVSGWGGDELASFNGRGVLRNLARRGKLRMVWRETSRRLEVTSGSAGVKERARSSGVTLLDAAPAWIPDLRHRSQRRHQSEVDAEIDTVLRSVSPLAADTRLQRRRTFEQASDHHEIQLALLTGGHLQRRCESWYQTGRLFDVSYRYPLLDLDVVIAALSIHGGRSALRAGPGRRSALRSNRGCRRRWLGTSRNRSQRSLPRRRPMSFNARRATRPGGLMTTNTNEFLRLLSRSTPCRAVTAGRSNQYARPDAAPNRG